MSSRSNQTTFLFNVSRSKQLSSHKHLDAERKVHTREARCETFMASCTQQPLVANSVPDDLDYDAPDARSSGQNSYIGVLDGNSESFTIVEIGKVGQS